LLKEIREPNYPAPLFIGQHLTQSRRGDSKGMSVGRSERTNPEAEPVTQSSRIIGTGEMAALVRAYDWGSTALGAIDTWSLELLTVVNLTLSSPSPARTMWGPDFILIYNDAYRPIPGPRHPEALGKSARGVYSESWHVVGPLLEKAFATGETLFYEKLLVPLPTHNGVQDFYLNYSFNPIYEGRNIAGLFGPLHDVTGEVMAARKLKESEARATRIFESIGDAVIVTDAEGSITHINSVAQALTGWTHEQATGRALTEVFRVFSEETGEMVENPVQKVKRLGSVAGLANHTILKAKDGTEIHIDDTGAPIRSEEGELNGIVLVFRDINERRAAERERDAVAEQLKQVLESTTDAIISVDRNWRIAFTNAPARAIVAPIDLLTGKSLWECLPAAVYEASPYVEHYNRAMYEGIAGQFEAHYTGPLNIWVQVNVRPSRDGIVIFFRDVTQEKLAANALEQATEALKASDEELRWTIELSSQSPWAADPAGHIVDFSDSWLELTGLTREQALGDGWSLTHHPDDAPRMSKAWQHALLTGEPYDVEHRIRTASGLYRWVRSSALPRRDGAGIIVKWYGATEDIEERKRAEQAVMQSEKLAAVGRLASSIAHEINNPLEAVTNLVYLARQRALIPEVQGYLETAEQELRRVSAIASQTLRFYRQTTHPQSIRGHELIESVLSVLKGRFANSRISVERRDRALKPVKCFEGEIRQVLSNLLTNAIDAMQPRGGRLLLRCREATHGKTGCRGIAITVADTGCGIDRQTLQKIFEAFFTTKDIGGTGLGLWISKDIVNRHHGELKVRSSQRPSHCGTVFTLFLPFDAESA
jgi:PAS domain S-box-containing protein